MLKNEIEELEKKRKTLLTSVHGNHLETVI